MLEDLRALGLKPEGPFQSGNSQWVILPDYEIPAGRFVGTKIRLAVPVPADYPATPPGGLHVSPDIVPAQDMGARNIHDRQSETEKLPGKWQYWSRPYPKTRGNEGETKWRADAQSTRRLQSHWNAVLSHVA